MEGPPPDAALDDVRARLAAAGCVSAAAEAAALLHAAGRTGTLLDGLVRRREAGEPLAWIIGWVDFGGVPVRVAPGVYVPRPHTVALAGRAAEHLPERGTAVDLCTGSGAVAAYLRARRPHARIVACDIDETAVVCARGNGVEAYGGDLYGALPGDLAGAVDVMTSVPPYVPGPAMPFLARDVRAWEPARALDGGPDGLTVVGRIIAGAARWLVPGGRLLVEVGGELAGPVGDLAADAGLTVAGVIQDREGDLRGIDLRRGPG